jgi:hypothetical protein
MLLDRGVYAFAERHTLPHAGPGRVRCTSHDRVPTLPTVARTAGHVRLPANDMKLVKPTRMNLSVLAECLKKGGGTIGPVEATDAPSGAP